MLKLFTVAIAATSLAAGVGAQTTMTHPAAKATTAKPVMATKATTTKTMTTRTTMTRPAAVTTSGKMATTTTKTGKKITYDCSKKGNMNKTACKR